MAKVVATELVRALTNPSPSTLFGSPGGEKMSVLNILANIFINSTPATQQAQLAAGELSKNKTSPANHAALRFPTIYCIVHQQPKNTIDIASPKVPNSITNKAVLPKMVCSLIYNVHSKRSRPQKNVGKRITPSPSAHRYNLHAMKYTFGIHSILRPTI